MALALLAGCEDYDSVKPLSGGDIDEVIIIVENDRMESRLAAELTDLFGQAYMVVNEAESAFDAKLKTYYQFVEAKDLLKKYRTLMLCTSADRQSELGGLIEAALGADLVARSAADTHFLFSAARDVYAKPQLVIYAYAPTEDQLIRRLHTQQHVLRDAVIASENERLREMVYAQGVDTATTALVRDQFGIRVTIPTKYRVMRRDSSLIWIQKEELVKNAQGLVIKEKKFNIAMRAFDINGDILALSDTAIHWPVAAPYVFALRDSMGKSIRSGRLEVPLMIEKKYAPLVQSEFTREGHRVIESRGLWNMHSMGGPFINWLIFLDDSRAVMIDAFLYAAGSQKRPLMRELEAVLSTLEVGEAH